MGRLQLLCAARPCSVCTDGLPVICRVYKVVRSVVHPFARCCSYKRTVCGTGGRWFEPTQLYHNKKLPCGSSIVLIDLTYLLALNTKSATNGSKDGCVSSFEEWRVDRA